MHFGVFAALIVLLALVAVYFGGKLLVKPTWLLGWLRGSAGLVLLLAGALFVMVALDLSSYKQLLEEEVVLTLSFEKVDEQKYRANVAFIDDGREESYEVFGDQWQVDARVIRWLGLLQTLGVTPAYRLDRLSGRYYSLEDEHRKQRSAYQLYQDGHGLDVWAWLKDRGRFMPWVDAVYGSATYLPMEDGAIYQVALSHNGLIARPVNSIAEGAVNRWQ